jgi:hypothetical protein
MCEEEVGARARPRRHHIRENRNRRRKSSRRTFSQAIFVRRFARVHSRCDLDSNASKPEKSSVARVRDELLHEDGNVFRAAARSTEASLLGRVRADHENTRSPGCRAESPALAPG